MRAYISEESLYKYAPPPTPVYSHVSLAAFFICDERFAKTNGHVTGLKSS